MKEEIKNIVDAFVVMIKAREFNTEERVICEDMILLVEGLVREIKLDIPNHGKSELDALSNVMLYDVIRECVNILTARTQGSY
jgi:hypothetical protein